jgi:hypothetical protein
MKKDVQKFVGTSAKRARSGSIPSSSSSSPMLSTLSSDSAGIAVARVLSLGGALERRRLESVTKEYEESFMRPARPDERMCRVANCVSLAIMKCAAPVFRSPAAHTWDSQCVLCLRHETTLVWARTFVTDAPTTTSFAPYRVEVGPGQYDRSALLYAPTADPTDAVGFYGFVDPFVRFSWSSLIYDPENRKIAQIGLDFRRAPTLSVGETTARRHTFAWRSFAASGPSAGKFYDANDPNGRAACAARHAEFEAGRKRVGIDFLPDLTLAVLCSGAIGRFGRTVTKKKNDDDRDFTWPATRLLESCLPRRGHWAEFAQKYERATKAHAHVRAWIAALVAATLAGVYPGTCAGTAAPKPDDVGPGLALLALQEYVAFVVETDFHDAARIYHPDWPRFLRETAEIGDDVRSGRTNESALVLIAKKSDRATSIRPTRESLWSRHVTRAVRWLSSEIRAGSLDPIERDELMFGTAAPSERVRALVDARSALGEIEAVKAWSKEDRNEFYRDLLGAFGAVRFIDLPAHWVEAHSKFRMVKPMIHYVCPSCFEIKTSFIETDAEHARSCECRRGKITRLRKGRREVVRCALDRHVSAVGLRSVALDPKTGRYHCFRKPIANRLAGHKRRTTRCALPCVPIDFCGRIVVFCGRALTLCTLCGSVCTVTPERLWRTPFRCGQCDVVREKTVRCAFCFNRHAVANTNAYETLRTFNDAGDFADTPFCTSHLAPHIREISVWSLELLLERLTKDKTSSSANKSRLKRR